MRDWLDGAFVPVWRTRGRFFFYRTRKLETNKTLCATSAELKLASFHFPVVQLKKVCSESSFSEHCSVSAFFAWRMQIELWWNAIGSYGSIILLKVKLIVHLNILMIILIAVENIIIMYIHVFQKYEFLHDKKYCKMYFIISYCWGSGVFTIIKREIILSKKYWIRKIQNCNTNHSN